VQPPVSVLERMLTVRLHLDDAPLSNGPLLVVRGSHRRGIIDLRSLDAAECERNASPLLAAAGDAVLMRPLMLHASKKSLAAVHRRVLHLEFAADPLPDGLEWDVELELCAPVQSS
jgi:ectoine hydroxylase-related dioxygenase (phytanoyl-CoA dioxygenase family)